MLGKGRWAQTWLWVGDGGTPCPLPSCLRGSSGCQSCPAPCSAPRQDQLSPAAFAEAFSAPLGWRWDSQWALQMQSSSCIQTEVFPPCSFRWLFIARYRWIPSSFQHLTARGYLPPHLCSWGLHTPARQPVQVPQCHTDLWQVSLYLPMLLLLFLISITQWYPKQGIFTGEMVAGLGRALEVRCSFYISQQYFFFSLFFFFFLQYNTPASHLVCNPLHPPALFCRVATLPASPCTCLGFYTPIPYLLG